MVDETERAAYEIALRAALRDQARATATVEFFREKLGIAAAAAPRVITPGDIELPDEPTVRDVGPVHVAEGEFYGMSQPKAAVAFLERAGRSRPQRTEAIVAALKQGGVKFDSKDPVATFYTILRRLPAFHRVGRSTWGLAAWYPNAAKKAPKVNEAAQPPDDDGAGSEGEADQGEAGQGE